MNSNIKWFWKKICGDDTENIKEPKPVVPFELCPFRHASGDTDPCAGVKCQLWSISIPFSAMERTYPNGMCSIKLLAEAQAYISRGNELGGLEGK